MYREFVSFRVNIGIVEEWIVALVRHVLSRGLLVGCLALSLLILRAAQARAGIVGLTVRLALVLIGAERGLVVASLSLIELV